MLLNESLFEYWGDANEDADYDKRYNVLFYNWIYLMSIIICGTFGTIQMYMSIRFFWQTRNIEAVGRWIRLVVLLTN